MGAQAGRKVHRRSIARDSTPTRASEPEPITPIPIDPAHEFLSAPLAFEDPILTSWCQHFHRHHVPFILQPAPDGGYMIYKHRVRLKHTTHGVSLSVWCCRNGANATLPRI